MSYTEAPSPMESLPSELKENICSHLDRGSLYSLLQVSKSQWAIAEPWIYKHVRFQAKEARHVRLLLLSLVSQPDLAARIKSVDVLTLHPENSSHFDFVDAWDDVYASLDPIKTAINSIIYDDANRARNCLGWLSSILSTKVSPGIESLKLSHAYECFEASLALIVGLAVNIETITFAITCWHSRNVRKGYEIIYGETFMSCLSMMNPEHHSSLRQMIWFIKESCQRSKLPDALLSLEKLVTRRCVLMVCSWGKPALQLHTLVLADCKLNLGILEDLLRGDLAPNLAQLTLQRTNCLGTSEDFYTSFPITLKEHCPRLKSLHINVIQSILLGNLEQLPGLEELVLSSKHLLPREDLTLLFVARERLPPNITSLRVMLPDTDYAEAMVCKFLEENSIQHTHDQIPFEKFANCNIHYQTPSIWHLPGPLVSTSLKSLELATAVGLYFDGWCTDVSARPAGKIPAQ
jgi:hypothetical protein